MATKTGRAYASLVDEVRSLPTATRLELRHLIDRSLIDERRQEIAESYSQGLQELADGKLRFSTDTAELMADLDD